MRLIDADKLKKHYAWWNNENKEIFDAIVDAQPTVETQEAKSGKPLTCTKTANHEPPLPPTSGSNAQKACRISEKLVCELKWMGDK